MLPGKPRVKPGGLHGAGEQVTTRDGEYMSWWERHHLLFLHPVSKKTIMGPHKES